ncbi:hypothetical protein DL95DRAFT_508947, partial [Leptodontidium sp. 2 PMI_412]
LAATYDHRLLKIGHPVRSAIHKQEIGRLVVGWVTTSEYLLLYVFCFIFWLANHVLVGLYVQKFLLARVKIKRGAWRWKRRIEVSSQHCMLCYASPLFHIQKFHELKGMNSTRHFLDRALTGLSFIFSLSEESQPTHPRPPLF